MICSSTAVLDTHTGIAMLNTNDHAEAISTCRHTCWTRQYCNHIRGDVMCYFQSQAALTLTDPYKLYHRYFRGIAKRHILGITQVEEVSQLYVAVLLLSSFIPSQWAEEVTPAASGPLDHSCFLRPPFQDMAHPSHPTTIYIEPKLTKMLFSSIALEYNSLLKTYYIYDTLTFSQKPPWGTFCLFAKG